MKKSIRHFLVLVVLATMLLGTVPVSAATRSSDYLSGYAVTAIPLSGARIAVNVEVSALGYMDEIGATYIYIHESTDNGVSWSWKATYSHEDYPGFIGSGIFFDEDLVIYQGVAGRKYRAVAYCYAGNSTGFDQKLSTSNTVIAYN